MMQPAYNFPCLSSEDLLIFLQGLFLDEFAISENDLKNPQPLRVQALYSHLLEATLNITPDQLKQPQLEATNYLSYNELHEDSVPLIMFTLVMQRFMASCGVNDFKLKDLTAPKPKRFQRNLSAIVNYYRFKEERVPTFERIKQETDATNEQYQCSLREIDEMKAKINKIKAKRAEDEPQVQQLCSQVEELGACMSAYQKEQAIQQKEIQQLKSEIAEKVAKTDQYKVTTLSAREDGDKLRIQIVQSPEKMKTKIDSMHSAINSSRMTKEDKALCLQEKRTQREKMAAIHECCEQVSRLISAINCELDKQREASGEVEKVRDNLSVQRDVLRDLTAKENQFKRQVVSKQERKTKFTLQHQSKMTATSEALQMSKKECEMCEEKQQKLQQYLNKVKEEMENVQQERNDKVNKHEDDMKSLQDTYASLLEAVDGYHRDIATTWNKVAPWQVSQDEK
ncbi:kinetochore protein Nuf2-like isoform X2 [Anneissia japonica]|nr:kinetochore protein Nuf2-like isoform X2 [Anneissia japonica]XP_033119289.1 kinetochore protein Nuf2-like isoform X2 [Anneissia japonica]XP_033119290.1 kinetochore protein Nuf2-like isoform X2 [Anneissia japonica]